MTNTQTGGRCVSRQGHESLPDSEAFTVDGQPQMFDGNVSISRNESVANILEQVINRLETLKNN